MPRVRISALSNLTRCEGFFLARIGGFDKSGAAAQTGSAAGRGIELWHRGLDAGAMQAAFEDSAKWPEADWEQATAWVAAYCADPRNAPDAVVPGSLEGEYSFTRGPFTFVGHVDQLRRGPDGGLEVWDVKTSKGGGTELLHEYCWQLSAYAVAVAETTGERTRPGGIIRLRGYDLAQRPAPAFFYAPWDYAACLTLVDSAVAELERLRSGVVSLRPGVHCQWCPYQGPQNCTDPTQPLLGEALLREWAVPLP